MVAKEKKNTQNERDFQYELFEAITIIFANKSEMRLACACVCGVVCGLCGACIARNAISSDWKFLFSFGSAHCYSSALQPIFSFASDVIAHQSPSQRPGHLFGKRKPLRTTGWVRRECCSQSAHGRATRACNDNMGIMCLEKKSRHKQRKTQTQREMRRGELAEMKTHGSETEPATFSLFI